MASSLARVCSVIYDGAEKCKETLSTLTRADVAKVTGGVGIAALTSYCGYRAYEEADRDPGDIAYNWTFGATTVWAGLTLGRVLYLRRQMKTVQEENRCTLSAKIAAKVNANLPVAAFLCGVLAARLLSQKTDGSSGDSNECSPGYAPPQSNIMPPEEYKIYQACFFEVMNRVSEFWNQTMDQCRYYVDPKDPYGKENYWRSSAYCMKVGPLEHSQCGSMDDFPYPREYNYRVMTKSVYHESNPPAPSCGIDHEFDTFEFLPFIEITANFWWAPINVIRKFWFTDPQNSTYCIHEKGWGMRPWYLNNICTWNSPIMKSPCVTDALRSYINDWKIEAASMHRKMHPPPPMCPTMDLESPPSWVSTLSWEEIVPLIIAFSGFWCIARSPCTRFRAAPILVDDDVPTSSESNDFDIVEFDVDDGEDSDVSEQEPMNRESLLTRMSKVYEGVSSVA